MVGFAHHREFARPSSGKRGIYLDDLFTERRDVVTGMEDIYKTWVDFGIDGFRIDTVKHVNMEFWQSFSPALLDHAEQSGNDDFFMFGEIADPDPLEMSRYSTRGTLPAALDFGFQKAAQEFVAGGAPQALGAFYRNDDLYTDADSNAYSLPTFTGNHDMGRLPFLLNQGRTGANGGFLGLPMSREMGPLTRGGYGQHFAGGSVYWSPAGGAAVVRGAIRDRWAGLGWENSWLGYPTGEEFGVRGGIVQRFQGGLVY